MDVDDCRLCSYLSYDCVDNVDVCMFHNCRPVADIVLCLQGDLTFEQESLIIEEDMGK